MSQLINFHSLNVKILRVKIVRILIGVFIGSILGVIFTPYNFLLFFVLFLVSAVTLYVSTKLYYIQIEGNDFVMVNTWGKIEKCALSNFKRITPEYLFNFYSIRFKNRKKVFYVIPSLTSQYFIYKEISEDPYHVKITDEVLKYRSEYGMQSHDE